MRPVLVLQTFGGNESVETAGHLKVLVTQGHATFPITTARLTGCWCQVLVTSTSWAKVEGACNQLRLACRVVPGLCKSFAKQVDGPVWFHRVDILRSPEQAAGQVLEVQILSLLACIFASNCRTANICRGSDLQASMM